MVGDPEHGNPVVSYKKSQEGDPHNSADKCLT